MNYALHFPAERYMIPINDVLQYFVQSVSYVKIAIGVRRAIMEYEQGASCILPLKELHCQSLCSGRVNE